MLELWLLLMAFLVIVAVGQLLIDWAFAPSCNCPRCREENDE